MSQETDVIERDHLREKLYEHKLVVEEIWRELRGTDNPLLPRIERLSMAMHQSWLFRSHACPKCGGPAEFMFAMMMVGPDFRSWNCPKCGRHVDAGDRVLPDVIYSALMRAGWRRVSHSGWCKDRVMLKTTDEAIAAAIAGPPPTDQTIDVALAQPALPAPVAALTEER